MHTRTVALGKPSPCMSSPSTLDPGHAKVQAPRWTKDTPHQQRLRDVMGLEIGDGTAGVMKLIVARERVGRAAVQYQ